MTVSELLSGPGIPDRHTSILCGRRRVAARQGRWEVISQMGEIRCPRCKKTFVMELNETRFRAGSFYDDDREQSFDQLCEDCHREVVK